MKVHPALVTLSVLVAGAVVAGAPAAAAPRTHVVVIDKMKFGAVPANLHRGDRIVWVNPRSAAEGFEPLAGGMAAALPHCSVVLSGHSLEALDAVVEAIGGTG